MRDFSFARAGVLLSGSITGLAGCVVAFRYLDPQLYFEAVRFVQSIIDGFRDGIARMLG